MILIGIFGLKNKEERLRSVDFECTGCLSEKMELYAFRQVLEVFFIPIITLKKKHIITCSTCKSSYKLKEGKMEEILLKGKVKYEDVEEIVKEY
ncbi:zinc-ribbon domain-containing protein [Cetobacterium somerae]|uniref:zinc-ribbon domain-containing protein n=1 Tax=Cetobacterium sp. NK01 TaxID=2993530 RepID=UPI0021171487|nr:zinc-ribbon domain-containing protein [Cetobacterium sp. NK01]MCQ8212989.1 zinc-ribbon domain-containing protein [Cetobacterium sp. NK01]